MSDDPELTPFVIERLEHAVGRARDQGLDRVPVPLRPLVETALEVEGALAVPVLSQADRERIWARAVAAGDGWPERAARIFPELGRRAHLGRSAVVGAGSAAAVTLAAVVGVAVRRRSHAV